MAEKKRVIFSEEEKNFVRKLVLKNKEIVENKRSDAVTVVEKKRCWERITEEFNSTGNFPLRTVVQLRKMWENVKTRRKHELTAEKKKRMKAGVSSIFNIPDDPELDGLGVHIELPNALDSDTLANSTAYAMLGGGKSSKEEDLKMQRTRQFMAHEDELQALKVKEMDLRIKMLEKDLAMKTKEAEQGEVLFELRKKNLLLEQQLLKKKLTGSGPLP